MTVALWDISQLAEDAIRDVRLIHHDYMSARWTGGTKAVGRFDAAGPSTNDRATQLAIAAMSAVVEHYVENVLLDAHRKPQRIRDWPGKRKEWKKVYGVDVAVACGSFSAVLGFYEARTAVIHRQGELTLSQQTKREVFDNLRAAGITLSQYRLLLTPTIAEHCETVCTAAIEELDRTRAAQVQHN